MTIYKIIFWAIAAVSVGAPLSHAEGSADPIKEIIDNLETRINELNLPIFTSTCKYPADVGVRNDYEYLMLIYFSKEGWLLLKEKSGRITPVATTGNEGMDPFSWEIGGMWTVKILDLNSDILQAQGFKYKEKIDFKSAFEDQNVACTFSN